MEQELDEYKAILLGREDLPIQNGVMSLIETATAMYGRASEMTMEILAMERKGSVTKGSRLYKFRTGELRTFLDMCSKFVDLGSRRITAERMKVEMRNEGY